MDHTSIPACASYTYIGTVIISRAKMEVTCDFCQLEAYPATGCAKDQHKHKYLSCELCTRTRLDRQLSGCDSEIGLKTKPCRSHPAVRTKYANLCAAVCLLLLVGALSQSSAAPHKGRSRMDRQKRAAGASQENRLWANPCDYNDSYVNLKATEYTPVCAKQAAAQARSVALSAAKYKDTFASKLHSFPSFNLLLEPWSEHDFLHGYGSWFRDEVLPKEKVLNHPMPDEEITKLMTQIDEVLPPMYKSLKLIVASLSKISNVVKNDNVMADDTLKKNIDDTVYDVRRVLCQFNDIMTSRKLKIMPLLDSEVPDINNDNKLEMEVLVYRDTLNYLEYLAQVFQKMYDTQTA